MSGQDFAAMLLANNKSRFFVEMHVHWRWNPHAQTPTEPWEIRTGCHQGHSNQTINPYEVHHVLTPDEAGPLGWIFHVTSPQNQQSIERFGLQKNPKGQGKGGGRDAVHFMYHNDNSDGYIRMAEGTAAPL